MSSTLEQCVLVYNSMLEQSERVDDETFVWEGSLTTLLENIGLSRAKYSQIVNPLKDMGCISQVRRGAGNTASRWLVHGVEPNEDAFMSVLSKEKGRGPDQRITDLSNRLTELERTVAFLMREYMERDNEVTQRVDEGMGI